MEELRARAPHYVSELDLSKETGSEIALIKLFAHLLKLLMERENRVPEKNFIAFLDMLGIKLLPALPASVPISFALSEGTKEHVLIPARTQIAAGDVVFETEKNILASPAKLKGAYSIDVSNDAIYKGPSNVISGESVVPFQTKLRYKAEKGVKEIFVGSTEGLKKDDVLIIGKGGNKKDYGIVSEVTDTKITFQHELENIHNASDPVEKVTTFELFEGKNLQEHILYLGHEDLFNIKSEATIQINVTDSQSALKLGASDIVQWEYWGEAVRKEDTKEIKEIDWHPLNISGPKAEKSQAFQLIKKLAGEIKECEIQGIKSRWIRCKTTDITKTRDIELDTIHIGGVQFLQFFKLPPRAIRGVGETFGKRLSDKGVNTIEELLKFKNRVDELAKILAGDGEKEPSKYYKEQAENILENAQKRVLDKEYEDMAIKEVVTQGLLPDMAFYNDVPLDFSTCSETKPIYPFGVIPRLYDTFYIASQEAFSKKGATITFTIEVFMDSDGDPSPNPSLSWEYWDGKGWVRLSDISCSRNNVSCSEHLGFDDYKKQNSSTFIIKVEEFPALELTKVHGQENFWIRVRLVGGHYGQEVYIDSSSNVKQGKVTPPKITSLSIDYNYGKNGENLAHCLTYNNLEFTDVTEECKTQNKVYKPFLPLDDQHQTLYLGFDNKLEKGPVSIFFSVEEQLLSSDKIPGLEWEYYAEGGEWVRLAVLDETRGFMRSGTVEFVFPLDFKKTKKFGEEFYWIRAVEVKDFFKEETARPGIKGIFLNTTWAVQAETIKDELIGSSEGTHDQKFTLTKTPIISEEVWVNEMGSIMKGGDKTCLEQAGFEVQENKDSKGKVTEFWVKWKPVEALLASSKDDRHYELDRVSGELKFGDGIYGMIPPVGIDNITASYRSGGGINGNLAAHEVKDLKSSISFVDKALNPLAASGGSETETTDKAIERGPQVLKHRNRAITAEDFEQMAYQASQAIVKAKCLPNFHQAQWEPGWVTVVLMPESKEDKPTLSLQLKRQVEEYLKNHSANTLVAKNRLQVSEPVYWAVNVTTTLFATSIDVIPVVEKEVFIKLREFLHPLTGGYEGKGWDFGRLPCLSDFYALLEKIEGVDHVESLSIELKSSAKDQLTSSLFITPGRHVDIEMPPDAMICNGEHEVTIQYENSAIGG